MKKNDILNYNDDYNTGIPIRENKDTSIPWYLSLFFVIPVAFLSCLFIVPICVEMDRAAYQSWTNMYNRADITFTEWNKLKSRELLPKEIRIDN